MKRKLFSVLSMLLVLLVAPILSACGPAKGEITIEVRSSFIQEGNVYGSATYEVDDTVTLTAQPIGGATFIAWIKNNVLVSEENVFEFKATRTSGGTYTAVFKGETPTYYNVRQITLLAKHKLDLSYDVVLTGLNLQISQINSSHTHKLFESAELNLDLTNETSQAEPLVLQPEFFLSRNSSFKLLTNATFSRDGLPQQLPAKSVDFSFASLTVIQPENLPSFHRLTLTMTNIVVDLELRIDFYPAGFEFE